MRRHLLTTTAGILLAMAGSAYAGMDEAKSFLDKEVGDLSTLSRADQEKEMQWFVDAAKPFAGMDIKVVSETLTTHEYESKVLAPATQVHSPLAGENFQMSLKAIKVLVASVPAPPNSHKLPSASVQLISLLRAPGTFVGAATPLVP